MPASDNSGIVLEEIPCPLCNSLRSGPLLQMTDRWHGVPGEFHIVRCRDCRHTYLNPRPTAETLSRCYPGSYVPHLVRPVAVESDSKVISQSESTPWYLRPTIRRLPGLRSLYYWLTETRSTFLPRPENESRRAVELGCATGSFLNELKQAGWHVEGVDLVESAAAVCRERGFTVHVGTLCSASLPEESFDAAFAWHVVEHLTDPVETMQEFHRILRPGAWLAFSLPNAGCWEPTVFGSNWYCWEPPRHLHHFTVRHLKQLLQRAGFERIQIIHQRNLFNVIGSLGFLLCRFQLTTGLGRRLLGFLDHPTMWWQLLLAPLAITIASCRQGGRVTVVARRAQSTPAQ